MVHQNFFWPFLACLYKSTGSNCCDPDDGVGHIIFVQLTYLSKHWPKPFYIWSTVMCLSIGTPKINEFSICSKCKIYYL